MVKILNETNIEDLKLLMANIDTLMGQNLFEVIPWTGKTHKEILIDVMINNWLLWGNKTKAVFGWFEDNKLRAVLFQDFSLDTKAWSITYYIADYNNYRGIYAGAKCFEHATDNAESAGYYEYYRVIDASKIKVYDRAWKESDRKRYIMVVDEIVPAFEKPIIVNSWNWLYGAYAKPVDTAIVKGILLPEYRKFN
jgi:hypothetical protein